MLPTSKKRQPVTIYTVSVHDQSGALKYTYIYDNFERAENCALGLCDQCERTGAAWRIWLRKMRNGLGGSFYHCYELPDDFKLYEPNLTPDDETL